MRHDPLLRCFAFYRPHWRILSAATAIGIVGNLAMPLTFVFLGHALNDLRAGRGGAWWWAWALVSLAVGRGLVQYLGTVLSMAAGQRLLHDLRLAIFTQVQRLDPAWHQAHGTGEVVARTTRDSDKVRDAVTGGFRTMLELAVLVIAVLASLLLYHPLLGAVPAALVAVGLVMVARQGRAIARLDAAVGDAYDRVLQDLDEGVRGVRVVKSFSLEAERAVRFAGHEGAYRRSWLAAGWFHATRMPLPQLLVALGHVWVLAAGAWLVARGEAGIGTLVASMLLMQMVIFRVEAVGALQQLLAEAHASASRIMEILDSRPGLAGGEADLPPRPLGLRWRGVSVALGGRRVLDGLDLDLAPGEVVALVGLTGSGKSTIAATASRLRDPDAGAVEIGGAGGWTDLRRVRRDDLRRAVQVVFQDSFLFSDSVAGNLRRAAPAADDAALRRALVRAAADEVVDRALPDGLASRVGERGATLSGGQRQRLCLARAFAAEPAVVVADDATSALDAVTERRILDQLRRPADGAAAPPSLLLIASKLSTILLADRVVLLADGRIAASGSHEELLASSPAYRELVG